MADLNRKTYGEGSGRLHEHWSPYDMALEGGRFARLHEIAAAGPFDAAAARELAGDLTALAHSKGYGEADSYLTDMSRHTDEEIAAIPGCHPAGTGSRTTRILSIRTASRNRPASLPDAQQRRMRPTSAAISSGG